MTRLILMKTHPCLQLAHLYEHLFILRLKEYFDERGLIAHLDYSLYGTTNNNGGVILVEVTTYTPAASALLPGAAQLSIDLGPFGENITKQFMQIEAEESGSMKITDSDKLISALKTLDKTVWQNFEDLERGISAWDLPEDVEPLYMTFDPAEAKVTVSLDVRFSKKLRARRDLLPLARIVALSLAAEAQYAVSNEYGLYRLERFYDKKSHRVRADTRAVDGEMFRHAAEKGLSKPANAVYDKFFNDTSFSSFHSALTNEAYEHDPIEDMSNFGIFYSRKDWGEVLTRDNYQFVMENLEVFMAER